MVAYFDRLFRSLVVQAEVVKRVEDAGGRILAADIGEVSEATPAQWISGTMLGVVSEYYRRSVKERSGAGQALAVERGILPYPRVPVGYVRGPEGRLVVDDAVTPAVSDAFHMRVAGTTLAEVRSFLANQGIEKSYPGVQAMLRSRVYRGEIHFGKLVNLNAHEPLIDEATWQAAQAVRGKRHSGASRLLSRLRLLRCASCGTPLWLLRQGKYTVYRCGHPDCPKRVSIKATLIEEFVVDAVKAHHADLRGRASVAEDARGAEERAVKAQADLDAAIKAFAGLETEPAAVERIRELRDVRDEAVRGADHLRGLSSVLTIDMRDFDHMRLETRRGIIKATLAEVLVAPGRGLGRVTPRFVE